MGGPRPGGTLTLRETNEANTNDLLYCRTLLWAILRTVFGKQTPQRYWDGSQFSVSSQQDFTYIETV